MSILDGNGANGTRFLPGGDVGSRNGSGGDGGLGRGRHNLVTTQFLNLGPHLSDVRIDELSAVDCEVS